MLCFVVTYREISNIRRTKSPNLNVPCLVLQLSLPTPMKPGVKSTMTGDAPTTSEWSTILLLTKVRLILETLRYHKFVINWCELFNRILQDCLAGTGAIIKTVPVHLTQPWKILVKLPAIWPQLKAKQCETCTWLSVLQVKQYFGASFIENTWWRHQMETFSALLAICAGNSPVPGEFPAQRPVTRSFALFFDLRLNQRLRKQSRGWCFETIPRPLWRHCNDIWAVLWCVSQWRMYGTCTSTEKIPSYKAEFRVNLYEAFGKQ